MPSSACSKGETSARWWSSWFEPPRLAARSTLASLAFTLQTPQRADGANKLPSSLTGGSTELTKEISMFITLFAVLLVLWLLRISRLPRCGWAESPVANHSGDFFGDLLL